MISVLGSKGLRVYRVTLRIFRPTTVRTFLWEGLGFGDEGLGSHHGCQSLGLGFRALHFLLGLMVVAPWFTLKVPQASKPHEP